MNHHIPVLVDESIEALQVRSGGRYVDCTVGSGGHSLAILERGGRVLGIDIDPKAIEVAGERLSGYGSMANLINESFENLERICIENGFAPVDGVLFDLGMSSLQLSDPQRGFSFQSEGPLVMSFDPSEELTAGEIVNRFPEAEIADIIKRYGEEPKSRAVARAIVSNRPIKSTTHLASIVSKAVGFRGRTHPATRTFQALRIVVNRELERIKSALKQAVNILAGGGRLVVISFHSLEDRIVKEYFKLESSKCICPAGLPVCICRHNATLKLITKRVVIPSSAEVERNPLSRSAKMRVAERIQHLA